MCSKNHRSRSKGAHFDPVESQRLCTKMLHNSVREHINNMIKVAKIDDGMVPIVWGTAHRTIGGGYLLAATEYDKQSVEERQGHPHLTPHLTPHTRTLKCRERPVGQPSCVASQTHTHTHTCALSTNLLVLA